MVAGGEISDVVDSDWVGSSLAVGLESVDIGEGDFLGYSSRQVWSWVAFRQQVWSHLVLVNVIGWGMVSWQVWSLVALR